MPCTYCSNNKHTRAKCDKFEKDFKTYEKVSVLSREKYINTLLEKGINPGALVRTYNRTNNFMQKFSESKVVSLGSLDVFSHYKKIGRSIGSIYIESQELIELDDDNEKPVSVKHCYEVVETSTSEWDTTGSWTQTQLLDFDEFKSMFKGKKRHPAFTGELFNCIVKELTTKKQTTAEIIAEMEAEEAQEAPKTEKKEEVKEVARDYAAVFAHIKAAEPFKVGAKVYHKDDKGTDREGQVYEITVEHGYSKMWLDPYKVCSYEDLILVEAAVSPYEKLASSFDKMEVSGNTRVELFYSDGADVIHYNDTQDETAMEETSVIDSLISAARSGVNFSDDLIQSLRDAEMLDDYERDSYDFESHCAEKIKENPYDFCDFIDFSTEQYDHKRGYTTLTATLHTTVNDLRNAEEGQISSLTGWSAKFEADSINNGTITIEI
jgi:hypothetical protein